MTDALNCGKRGTFSKSVNRYEQRASTDKNLYHRPLRDDKLRVAYDADGSGPARGGKTLNGRNQSFGALLVLRLNVGFQSGKSHSWVQVLYPLSRPKQPFDKQIKWTLALPTNGAGDAVAATAPIPCADTLPIDLIGAVADNIAPGYEILGVLIW
jgi:hypothetical protein